MSFAGLIAGLSAGEQERLIRSLTRDEAGAANIDWASWAHHGQCAPPTCDDGSEWRTWVMIAGRGYGKTRAGAEWISGRVREALGRGEELSIALVGASIDEARRVMVEGRSGLLAVAADLIAAWHPSRRLLRFAGGSEATLFSGASPEGLRGPEHHFAWCDELAKWDRPDECWDMLQFRMRLGEAPRVLVTTTPRPGAVLRRIMGEQGSVTSGGSTYANPHLPAAFVGAVEGMYAGTRLGRQELDGELLSDHPGALWTVAMIEACRLTPLPQAGGVGGGNTVPAIACPSDDAPPPPAPPASGRGEAGARRRFEQVAIGVDPPSGGGTCGIVACARDRDGYGHMLGDHSVTGLSPEGWARAVAAAAALYPDPLIVAEANQGGQMVRSVLRMAGKDLRVKLVRAVEGKAARAVPVALLFEQGRVSVHGSFPALEAELCGLVSGGEYQGPGASPDRADAMVWAMGEVMLGVRVVRVRGF